MKYILIGLFTVFGLTSFAQEQAKVDKALKVFIGKFNDQKFDEIYTIFVADPSSASKQRFTAMLKDAYGMMGKLKSAKVKSVHGQTYQYIFFSKKNEIESDVTFKLDENLKFISFSFDNIGGKGDPPPMASKDDKIILKHPILHFP